MIPKPLSRRAVIGGGAALLLPGGLAAAADATDPVVRVREGMLRGRQAEGLVRFLGIPYAAPPVGARRFMPPAPAVPWRGVRDAVAYADAPIQPDPPAIMHVSKRQYLGADTSEDCLYLNVWAPAAPGRYPVFVWIHGGGNITGASSQPPADGAVYAREGIVCVTIGYRVGALGFLELGGVLGERYRGSGNNGLRDQIAALRWVAANIAAFGGDPARVTVGGESAGAKDVVALLASPLTRGLFRSAIVQSGGETVHGLAEADAFARSFVAGQPSPDALLSMQPDALLAVQGRAVAASDRPWPFRAVVGTDVLPVPPIRAMRAGAAADVRLLIGTNADESILFIDRKTAALPLGQRDLGNYPVAAVRPIEARYASAYPALDPLHRRVRLLTAEEYGLASFRIAETHRRRGAGTWVYRFAHPAAGGPFAGWTPHAADLPYVWNQLSGQMSGMIGPVTPGMQSLSDAIRRRWVAFTRGEDPWLRYDGQAIMAFDDTAHPASIDRAEYALWDELPSS